MGHLGDAVDLRGLYSEGACALSCSLQPSSLETPQLSASHRPGGHRENPETAPLVSVIIPCYNASSFVADAVDSVLNQNVRDVEIIVINDGSPDTQQLLEALRPYHGVVRYLDEPHRGPSRARNSGVAAAGGQYLAFLDADDYWGPEFLDRQLDVLRSSGADLVYCDAVLFGASEKAGQTVMDYDPSSGDVTQGSLLSGECVVVMSTVVARADCVRSVDGFDPGISYCEDLDLWIRMLGAGARIRYHDAPLAHRRLHSGNLSNHVISMHEAVAAVVKMHARRLPLSEVDRGRVASRLRDMQGSLHLHRAKEALRVKNAGAVRRELWAAFRIRKTPRMLAAALAFSLSPSLAVRLLRGRYQAAPQARQTLV